VLRFAIAIDTAGIDKRIGIREYEAAIRTYRQLIIEAAGIERVVLQIVGGGREDGILGRGGFKGDGGWRPHQPRQTKYWNRRRLSHCDRDESGEQRDAGGIGEKVIPKEGAGGEMVIDDHEQR
jgi:hypothetical protein